jgi:hypothetical protein
MSIKKLIKLPKSPSVAIHFFIALSMTGLVLLLTTPGQLSVVTPVEAETEVESETAVMIETVTESETNMDAQASFDLPIYVRPDQAAKISELRVLYRDQVLAYREAERQFAQSKQQHQQIKTLIALEEAVAATRLVYISRAKALITYTELVQVVFDSTPGIDLVRKKTVGDELTALVRVLQAHESEVEESEDRESINSRANEFEPLKSQFETTSLLALALISHGRLQNVVDQSQLMFQDIRKYHQEEEGVLAVRQSKRERAYKEIEQQLAQIGDDLNKEIQVIQRPEQRMSRSNYQRLLTNLKPIYARQSQTITYLEELLRL